jgi:ribonuclease R
MEQKILRLLGRKDYVPLELPQLLRQLRLRPDELGALQRALRDLEHSGQVIQSKGHRYLPAREADLIPGVIRINRQGKGFLQPDDPALQEIVVPESATSTALHGDRVLVRRDGIPPGLRRGDEDQTGAVVRILHRSRTQLVGTLQRSRQFLYVIPDDPRIPHDLYVPPPRDVGREAQTGDKVVVELREWTSRHTNPEGVVIEVLGPPDAEGVDMLSVLRQYQLPLHFPKEVLAEASAIAGDRPLGEPLPNELEQRTDCRAHDVVTIDPDDAKDFDDAIALRREGQDRWRLWVHIADVSHYVKPGTALDQEAVKRGNSTYLVDRVIPMLPEALSNEVCSLKPGVDRLTKCAEFVLSDRGDVLETSFYSAVIRSKQRFTYKDVFRLLQQPPADGLSRMLHQANELAQQIRRTRFKAGSLDLDFPENKIRLDAQGRILRIERIENDLSHQLIEEYMLLANQAVATRLMHRRIPAVYRVHEPPSERRLREYREEVLAHGIPCGNLARREEVQKLLQRLNHSLLGPALKIGFLRSLMRARYTVEPLGHYGLNKPKYTHFTSPIRRYADLVVHRSLFRSHPMSLQALGQLSVHISGTERNSDDAERDSRDVKLFAHLKRQLQSGQLESYPALLTDVRNFGFFVDVPSLGLSGLVHLSSVEEDFFQFDAARSQLVGRRTRRVFKLGDRITVQVQKVDSFKKQVDFRLAPVRSEGRPPRRTRSEAKVNIRRTRRE